MTILDRIANAQVKTKADMVQLMKDASFMMMNETGNKEAGIFTATQLLPQAEYAQAPEPHAPIYPTWFKLMREEAQKYNAKQTDQALLKSASWYFYNVEKKPTTNPEQYGIKQDDPVLIAEKKKVNQAKFIQWGMIGGSLIVGGTLLYFAFFRKPKSEKKSNPRQIKGSSRTITKGMVRSRRRNNPATPIKRATPAIPSGSSLAEYRKRFDAQKKKQAQSKAITKSNPKGKLRLKKGKF